jgi:hypothetical protein
MHLLDKHGNHSVPRVIPSSANDVNWVPFDDCPQAPAAIQGTVNTPEGGYLDALPGVEGYWSSGFTGRFSSSEHSPGVRWFPYDREAARKATHFSTTGTRCDNCGNGLRAHEGGRTCPPQVAA